MPRMVSKSGFKEVLLLDLHNFIALWAKIRISVDNTYFFIAFIASLVSKFPFICNAHEVAAKLRTKLLDFRIDILLPHY